MSIVKNYYLIDMDLISMTSCLNKIEQHLECTIVSRYFFWVAMW